MVVDSSVILAVYFAEPNSQWASLQLNKYVRELRMSTVNLTEVLIRVQDKQPQLFHDLRDKLLYSGIRFVPPDVEQAEIAAKARMNHSLNLGDCFAYALAIQENCPILTLDRDFYLLNHPIVYPDKVPGDSFGCMKNTATIKGDANE